MKLNQPAATGGSLVAAVRDAFVGIGLMLGARALILGLQLVVLALVARRLGPAAFGTLQLAIAIFTYVGFATDLGLTTVGTRESARRNVAALRGSFLWNRLALGGVAFTLIAAMLLVLPMPEENRSLVLVLCIGVAANLYGFRFLAQGMERFRLLATADVVAALVQLAGVALLVHGPDNLVGAGIAMILAPLVSTLILLIQPEVSSLARPRSGTSLGLLKIALPLGASAIAVQLYYNSDSILLGVMRGVADVGWYGAAYRVVYAVLAVTLAVHVVILPMLARLVTSDPAQVGPLLAASSRALMVFAVPCAIGLSLTSAPVVTTLFGSAYAPSATPLAILAWVSLTVSANAPFGALMLARGQDRPYLLVTAGGAILSIGANLLVIPRFGMTGAALVTVLQEVFVLAGFAWFARDFSLKILPAAIVRPAMAGAIMAIAIWPFRASLMAVPVGIVVFAIAALATGAVPAADLVRLIRATLSARIG